MEFRLVPLMLLLLWLVSIAPSASSETNLSPLPGCQTKCGDVNITFPFGIGAGCYRDPDFEITCTQVNGSSKAFLGVLKDFIEYYDLDNTNFRNGSIEEVVEIHPGYVRAHYNSISYVCYNMSSDYNEWVNTTYASFNLRGTPFRFSNTSKFTTIGCGSLAYIVSLNNSTTSASGCLPDCYTPGSTTNGSCQTLIPEDLTFFESYFNPWDFNVSPCSYSMIIEDESYKFTASDILGFNFYNKYSNTEFPVVLDWAIRDAASCSEAAKNKSSYACRSENSYCSNATNGQGYLCNCSCGYDGNPYLENGCKVNHTAGTCSKKPDKFPLAAKLIVGISVTLALSFLIVIELLKRKYNRERIEYFKLNRGQRLYDEMSRRQVDTFRFLTEQDLKNATNNFDKERILGAGGRGEVFKGELEDGRVVAIKKSKEVDENQKDEFVNEIIILFQINHRSVVRLLGCCFEVPVPMLVYEFIPNGTLSDFLHRNTSAIPLHVRLEIAVDSADALAYLHSSTARSVIHGDIKSLNILLDADYKAKVADFGASTLVPLDKDQLVELVQGTLGYLDPECISTQQLTDKSDVYSFGVVLLELITRKKAIYGDGTNEKISLASSFDLAMSQNRICDILDDQIVGEEAMEVLQEVAKLALHCLSRKREDRPTMNEVADKLKVLARFKHHPSGHNKPEEIQSLFGEMSRYSSTSDTTITMAYNSTGNGLVLNIDGGR